MIKKEALYVDRRQNIVVNYQNTLPKLWVNGAICYCIQGVPIDKWN